MNVRGEQFIVIFVSARRQRLIRLRLPKNFSYPIYKFPGWHLIKGRTRLVNGARIWPFGYFKRNVARFGAVKTYFKPFCLRFKSSVLTIIPLYLASLTHSPKLRQSVIVPHKKSFSGLNLAIFCRKSNYIIVT